MVNVLKAPATYSAYCHRYANTAIDSLFRVSIQKNLFPMVQKKSDGTEYYDTRVGQCTLSFSKDMSDKILLNDYIVVFRYQLGNNQTVKHNVGKRRNSGDSRGTIVFQGFVTHQYWSQEASEGGVQNLWNIDVVDLTSLLTEHGLFSEPLFSKKSGHNLADKFKDMMKRDYDIDIEQNEPIQRGLLVKKLINGYMSKRLTRRGGIWSGKITGLFTGVATQTLGLKFDEKALTAYDFVTPSSIFHGLSHTTNMWFLLNRLSSSPLYEVFVREDNGLIVFRRAAWSKIPPLRSEIGNYGLSIGQSWLHKLEPGEISFAGIHKTKSGLHTGVHISGTNASVAGIRLDDSFVQRYGYNIRDYNIDNYDPSKNTAAAALKSFFSQGLRGLSANVLGKFDADKIQEELLSREVANIFRAEISLTGYKQIAIGDHVKIWDSISSNLGQRLRQGFRTGFKGYGIKEDDFIYYVTGKTLRASVSENGRFTETMSLGLSFGALEFVSGVNRIKYKRAET